MATATLIPLEEYLRTSYEVDCDYVDGVLEERNLGKWKHGRLQNWLYQGFKFSAVFGSLIILSTRLRIESIFL